VSHLPMSMAIRIGDQCLGMGQMAQEGTFTFFVIVIACILTMLCTSYHGSVVM